MTPRHAHRRVVCPSGLMLHQGVILHTGTQHLVLHAQVYLLSHPMLSPWLMKSVVPGTRAWRSRRPSASPQQPPCSCWSSWEMAPPRTLPAAPRLTTQPRWEGWPCCVQSKYAVHVLRRLCLRLLPPGPNSIQARYTAQLGCSAVGQVCRVSLQLFLHATMFSRVLDGSVCGFCMVAWGCPSLSVPPALAAPMHYVHGGLHAVRARPCRKHAFGPIQEIVFSDFLCRPLCLTRPATCICCHCHLLHAAARCAGALQHCCRYERGSHTGARQGRWNLHRDRQPATWHNWSNAGQPDPGCGHCGGCAVGAGTP